MQNKSTNALRKKRGDLINKLNALDGMILRGSLVGSYKKCGKPGCKCENGEGHGPKYSMTINFPKQRPEHDYIPLKLVTEVKQYIANYHQFKDIIEQICAINREILKRRDDL
jgi:hypothetical protein